MATADYSLRGAIAVITLDNPPVNALGLGVRQGVADALERAQSDASVGAVVLTGAGATFCGGADVSEFGLPAMTASPHLTDLCEQVEGFPKPVVAALNGLALGGGLELAMCCHHRVALATAQVGLPEVKLGILPGYGGTQRLPRLVGRGRALEMLLSGEPVTAAEAHRIGLVNHVVPQAELLEFSRQWLRKVLANAPLALGLTMQAVDVGLEAGLEQGLRFEAAAFGLTTATEDKREGTRAFLEKRPAAFAGK